MVISPVINTMRIFKSLTIRGTSFKTHTSSKLKIYFGKIFEVAYGMYGEEQKYMQSYGMEILRKETTWNT
jgi:hypothetical protein